MHEASFSRLNPGTPDQHILDICSRLSILFLFFLFYINMYTSTEEAIRTPPWKRMAINIVTACTAT